MTWPKNLFIVAYLAIQLALPLRGCLYDKFETRGEFSWNMYSSLYACQALYRLDTSEGETRWLRHQDYFTRGTRSASAFFGDALPEFHRWLCDEFRHQGELGSIRGYVICSVNNGPAAELVDRSVDLCTAVNYGVRVQREAFEK